MSISPANVAGRRGAGDVSDVLLRLRREQRKYRRITSLLQKVGALLSFLLTALSVIAYLFEMFGVWFVQVLIIVLSVLTSFIWIAYGLSRKILTQITRRIREVRSKLQYEIVV